MTDERLTFSQLLRTATADAHSSAESHAYISSLMAGELDAHAMADLLLQTYPVYVALEAGLSRHAGSPLVAMLDDRALDRVAALESDLAWHFGPHWRARIDSGEIGYTPATLDYVTDLEDAGPEELVAHHYVRYLGDLSGGLAIRALVQRHYGLPDEALNFYSFPQIPKPKVYKDAYRAKLDLLPLDEEGRQRVLGHAVRAFALNEAVFAALGHHVGRVVSLAG
ncbi:MAG: biliverdin-producing heme oxygenase [Propionibacteriaceae bacterium]|nr:biliverdin-producing heme oxygenase [Propionibacteriaceae bacterium]